MSQTPLEVLYGPQFKNAPVVETGAANPWAGRTTIFAGSLSQVVSTNLVNSNSIILATTHTTSVGTPLASAGAIVVTSIVSGVSFQFAFAHRVVSSKDETVMWLLLRTD